MEQLKVRYTIISSPTTTQNPSIWCCQVEIEKGICVFENSKQNYMRQILKWHYRKHKGKWISSHISITMFNVTGILMPTGYDYIRNKCSSSQKCVFFKYVITAHVLYSNHVVYCNLFCVRFLRGTSKVWCIFFIISVQIR